MAEGDERRLVRQARYWERELGVRVVDPDGWRREGVHFAQPITKDDFMRMAAESTTAPLGEGAVRFPRTGGVARHDHDGMLGHLVDEWGALGVVRKVLEPLAPAERARLLQAAEPGLHHFDEPAAELPDPDRAPVGVLEVRQGVYDQGDDGFGERWARYLVGLAVLLAVVGMLVGLLWHLVDARARVDLRTRGRVTVVVGGAQQ